MTMEQLLEQQGAIRLINFKYLMTVATALWIIFVAYSSSTAFAQSKEDIYDMRLIKKGAHQSTSDLNFFWIEFGKNQINRLKYSNNVESVRLAEELELALEPAIQLEAEFQNAMGTDQEEQITRKMMEFSKELSRESGGILAQKVFDVLGVDYCRQSIAREIANELRAATLSKAQLSYSLASELQEGRFAVALSLTPVQNKQIEAAISNLTDRFKEELFKILDEISKLSDTRWQEILGALDSKQRRATKRFIGSPVEWFRELGQAQLHARLSRHIGGVGAKEKALEVANENNVAPDKLINHLKKMPRESLAELGLDIFNPLEWALIGDASVQKQLELSNEQLSALEEENIRLEKTLFYFPENGRFQALLNGEVTGNPIIAEILLPHQIMRFHQVEFQVRTDEKFDATVGLLDPRVIRFLQLSNSQKHEIQEIGNSYRIDFEKLQGKLQEIQQDYRKKLDVKLGDILDSKQNELFMNFTGRQLGSEELRQ